MPFITGLPGFCPSERQQRHRPTDSELVDEKIYPLCPSQKAETAVPEYEQIDWRVIVSPRVFPNQPGVSSSAAPGFLCSPCLVYLRPTSKFSNTSVLDEGPVITGIYPQMLVTVDTSDSPVKLMTGF